MTDEHGHHDEEITDAHEGHSEGYWEVMTDPGHMLAELTYEGIFFILGALWVKWKLRKRDEMHSHDL